MYINGIKKEIKIYKEKGELIYQIRYIANNHTVAQYLG